MAQKRTYQPKVKIGNWTEDQQLEEDAKKEYQEKKERGELTSQKEDLLKRNMFTPVKLSVTNDGNVHIGDVVMLMNAGGGTRECSAVSINTDIDRLMKFPSITIQAPCEVCAGRIIQPCTRTAFIITSVDDSPEGSTLYYEQTFALKTTSGFARGLYLTSDLRSFQKYAKKSRLQEVNLVEDTSYLSWWKIEYFNPQERLEFEGQPVPANVNVVIKHCKTNRALAVLSDHIIWTACGREYELTAHTFLDSHKAELDTNHWMLCTSAPVGGRLLIPDHSKLADDDDNTELTQENLD
ncbi:cilia- and flagella-associated protein 161 [Solea solea]|uniref:cilia- and flagella-associated protein 161 n=1 Tax=Solea solea TaxID=90069 RepID=UPI00272D2944|nr:cilia- and flagella-associated protein 161 [Solea solea]